MAKIKFNNNETVLLLGSIYNDNLQFTQVKP